jgi:hypothetical protein
MVDVEQKAQSLFSKVLIERGATHRNIDRDVSAHEALCRAIEQHEAFKQKVSDAAQEATEIIDHWSGDRAGAKCLQDFIIPKPKPDPLINVAKMLGYYNTAAKHLAGDIRSALDAAGFEIREKNDD